MQTAKALSAQADLSLGWAHMPFCWICREAAQFQVSQHLQCVCYAVVTSKGHIIV